MAVSYTFDGLVNVHYIEDNYQIEIVAQGLGTERLKPIKLTQSTWKEHVIQPYYEIFSWVLYSYSVKLLALKYGDKDKPSLIFVIIASQWRIRGVGPQELYFTVLYI